MLCCIACGGLYCIRNILYCIVLYCMRCWFVYVIVELYVLVVLGFLVICSVSCFVSKHVVPSSVMFLSGITEDTFRARYLYVIRCFVWCCSIFMWYVVLYDVAVSLCDTLFCMMLQYLYVIRCFVWCCSIFMWYVVLYDVAVSLCDTLFCMMLLCYCCLQSSMT